MKLALMLLTALLLGVKGRSTTYYFSNAGNDANTGTSSASPFRSLVKLNTLTLNAGDVILFKCGDVFRGHIRLNYSGTAG